MKPPGAAGPVQLPLALHYRPALERDVFLVTAGNLVAVEWIDRWPDWPGSALLLIGPRGSGKTHLASVWQARAGAVVIDGRRLDSDTIGDFMSQRPVVVEGAEAAPEEGLLHLFNTITEHRGSLLLTSVEAAARWPTKLPDLASRLRALPIAALPMPDDDLFNALLVKLFADCRLTVGHDVIDYLALRLERSFEAAGKAVAAIDAAALARRRRVTVPFVREILQL